MKKLCSNLLIAILIVGCSNDDDKGRNDDNIVGIWNVAEIIIIHPELGQEEATNIDGTIEFRSNGTGLEDYTFDAYDLDFDEIDSFNWVSTDNEVIIDPGTEVQLNWSRLINTSEMQRANYIDLNGISFNITLIK